MQPYHYSMMGNAYNEPAYCKNLHALAQLLLHMAQMPGALAHLSSQLSSRLAQPPTSQESLMVGCAGLCRHVYRSHILGLAGSFDQRQLTDLKRCLPEDCVDYVEEDMKVLHCSKWLDSSSDCVQICKAAYLQQLCVLVRP